MERDLIQGEAVERFGGDGILNLLDQLQLISDPLCSTAANRLSNPEALLRVSKSVNYVIS